MKSRHWGLIFLFSLLLQVGSPYIYNTPSIFYSRNLQLILRNVPPRDSHWWALIYMYSLYSSIKYHKSWRSFGLIFKSRKLLYIFCDQCKQSWINSNFIYNACWHQLSIIFTHEIKCQSYYHKITTNSSIH
jgi:hypothetical protein